MTKAETAALKTMTPEQLIEGFVREAKLEGMGTSIGTVREMNEHGAKSYAYLDEIGSRGGLQSLIPLLDLRDDWIAYRTASRLARHDETKDRAMATLDRLADSEGVASGEADRARNMIRYGDPLGDPVEVEKERAANPARYGRA